MYFTINQMIQFLFLVNLLILNSYSMEPTVEFTTEDTMHGSIDEIFDFLKDEIRGKFFEKFQIEEISEEKKIFSMKDFKGRKPRRSQTTSISTVINHAVQSELANFFKDYKEGKAKGISMDDPIWFGPDEKATKNLKLKTINEMKELFLGHFLEHGKHTIYYKVDTQKKFSSTTYLFNRKGILYFENERRFHTLNFEAHYEKNSGEYNINLNLTAFCGIYWKEIQAKEILNTKPYFDNASLRKIIDDILMVALTKKLNNKTKNEEIFEYE